MMDIRFKYEHDSLSNEYILTAKIYFGGSKLYLWDTTIEEAYTRALQLADIKTNVEWDLDEDEEDDEEDYEAYKDEELRVCRDECLEDYEYKYRYKDDDEGYDY
jgi:hypothetical protein